MERKLDAVYKATEIQNSTIKSLIDRMEKLEEKAIQAGDLIILDKGHVFGQQMVRKVIKR